MHKRCLSQAFDEKCEDSMICGERKTSSSIISTMPSRDAYGHSGIRVTRENGWFKRRSSSRQDTPDLTPLLGTDTDKSPIAPPSAGTTESLSSKDSPDLLDGCNNISRPRNVFLLGAKRQTMPPTDSSKMEQHSKINERSDSSESSVPSPPPMPRSYQQSSPKWVDRKILVASNAASTELNSMNASRPPKPESIWAEANRNIQPRAKTSQTKPKKMLSQSRANSESKPSTPLENSGRKSKTSTLMLKPKLCRTFTAPSTPNIASQLLKPSHAVDDALMHRALCIRDDLRDAELRELAMEAERAANLGQKKFVGSASKFGIESTPPSQQLIFADDQDFVLNPGPPLTPRRSASFVACANFPLDSYRNRKKLRVTSLRNFSEVVPNFRDMHNNIRHHLEMEGVNAINLPKVGPRRDSVVDDDNDEDSLSQVQSLSASHTGSMNSFGSYAVASLKGIVDYVGRSSKARHSSVAQTSSFPQRAESRVGRMLTSETMNSTIHESYSDGLGDSYHKENIDVKESSTTLTTMPADEDSSGSDSDDSSVELHRWKKTLPSFPEHADNSGNSYLADKEARAYSRAIEKRQVVLERKKLFSDSDKKRECSSRSFPPLSPSQSSLLEKRDSENPKSPQHYNTAPVVDFFSKIQLKLSRSPDEKGDISDEDNKQYITNYFYTCRNDTKIVDSKGISNLKLDINPDSQRDSFCMPGCGQNGLMSSCATVGAMVDYVFSLLSDAESSTNEKQEENESSQIVLQHNIIRTWQTDSAANQRNLFMPPKLCIRTGDKFLPTPDRGIISP
mmetsp:Transcript_19686/g.41462  ORF Transcript_19686/g.41462 Transcript_19686/m.41462 type:complete len:792 (-) Transcript_19686:70-2445(-)